MFVLENKTWKIFIYVQFMQYLKPQRNELKAFFGFKGVIGYPFYTSWYDSLGLNEMSITCIG